MRVDRSRVVGTKDELMLVRVRRGVGMMVGILCLSDAFSRGREEEAFSVATFFFSLLFMMLVFVFAWRIVVSE